MNVSEPPGETPFEHFGGECAVCELGVDETLAERLAAAFFDTADWMRNRGG